MDKKGKPLEVSTSHFLKQSEAAAAWWDDATDRLKRSGAKQVAPDMYELTKEQFDAIMLDSLEKKNGPR